MPLPSAKVVADSVSPAGDRLTTIEVTFHRWVLAEFNTHRAFSRNSASSRAIPLRKQIERVKTDVAAPLVWAMEQPGMSGADEDPEAAAAANPVWLHASQMAVADAERLGTIGIHKSIANRLLEPFQMHTAIVTSTAWQNFFHLRCSPLAQPEIRIAAEEMRLHYDWSTPKPVARNEWHMPYIDEEDIETAAGLGLMNAYNDHRTLAKISAARCARVSYMTHDGRRDMGEDLSLYEKLTTNGHSSPLEHVATPDSECRRDVMIYNHSGAGSMTVTLPTYGNFVGWHQHRWDVEIQNDYRAYV